MGYPTQQQKVDYLFKKIGFSKTKTGVAEDQTSGFSGDTKKAPPNEAIASPLIVPGSSVWSDSSFITATPPTSSTAYVGVYSTATAYRMTVDTTVANERTFIARQTWGNSSSAIEGDWIDTQFGADYLVKVYMGDPSTGVPGVAYTNLSAAGTSGKDDVWFFDYSSGVLNFNGADLDGQLAGISTDNVYLVGYRYVGRKGIQPPAGIGTFHDLVVSNNLSVGGISTFGGLIDANGIIEGIAGQNKIPSLYANYSDLPNAGTYHGMFAHVHGTQKGYFAHAGGWYELVNKETTGTVGTGTERYNIGPVDATSLKVTGITTLGNIGISTGRITGPAITYIDPATVGAAGTVVILGDLQVDGTQTTVNSSTMTVTDKNIELAKGAANDAAANGGGITVKSGGGDKTWQWLDATDSWTSSEHIRLDAGKVYGFSGDTNTYITNYQPDSIEMTTGGVERFELKATNSGNSTVLTISDDGNHGQLYGGTGVVVHGSSGARIKFAQNSLGYGIADGFEVGAYDGGGYLINREPTDIFFSIAPNSSSNPSELVRIKSTGQVGIGTDNPDAKLDVLGDTELQGNLNVGGATTITATNNAMPFSIVTSKSSGGIGTYLFKNSSGRFDFKFENTYNGNWHTGSTFHTRILWAAPNDTDTTPEVCSIMPNTASAGASGKLSALEFSVTDNTSGLKKAYSMSSNRHQFWVNGDTVALEANSSLGVGVTNYIYHAGSSPGDTDTRFGFSGNNNIIFDTNGTERLRINDSSSTFTNNIVASANLDVDGHTELDDLNVSGISTFGGAIDANSTSNFGDDVTLTGASYSVLWDKSENALEFSDDARATFGDSKQLKLYRNSSGSTSTIENTQDVLNISNTGTHTNIIASGNIYLKHGTNHAIVTRANAEVELYHNAQEKLATTSTGINITGLTDTDTLTTGNATFTGTISAGSTTGTDGYYLKSTGIGVTWAVLPSSRTTDTQTATAGQTSFNFSYNIGFVDVFLNGVKLPSSEFTANNGSTIVLDDAAFANDTLEFISLNTVPVSSSGGATNLDGLSDVTVTSPVYGQTLRYNGVKFVNDFHPHLTTTSTSQVSITNLPIASYRSAEYLIQVTEGTKYHVTKIIAIHDGTNVTFNEYGTITTSTSLATFALDINSGSMRLLATPASTNSTTFKVKFDAIAV